MLDRRHLLTAGAALFALAWQNKNGGAQTMNATDTATIDFRALSDA